MTPGTFCLIVRAAERMSFQLFGAHGTGRPACLKRSLLYQSARVSVPIGTPYVLPSSALAAFLLVAENWLQSGHAAWYWSSGARKPAWMSVLTRNVSSYMTSGAVLGDRFISESL